MADATDTSAAGTAEAIEVLTKRVDSNRSTVQRNWDHDRRQDELIAKGAEGTAAANAALQAAQQSLGQMTQSLNAAQQQVNGIKGEVDTVKVDVEALKANTGGGDIDARLDQLSAAVGNLIGGSVPVAGPLARYEALPATATLQQKAQALGLPATSNQQAITAKLAELRSFVLGEFPEVNEI